MKIESELETNRLKINSESENEIHLKDEILAKQIKKANNLIKKINTISTKI